MVKRWQKVDTVMVQRAVMLGRCLDDIEERVSRMGVSGENHDLGIILRRIKTSLNKAVREVDMMQYALEHPRIDSEDDGA